MAESPSSNPTSTAAVEGAAASRVDGVATAPEIVPTEAGVPVADLREAADLGGVLVLVDGVLTLRLADGTEWPIDVTVADGDVVLQVADRGFVAASTIEAALSGTDSVLPLTDLGVATEQAVDPANDADEAVEPAAADGLPSHGGGAGFRAFEMGDIGEGLDPVLALGMTDREGVAGIGNALQNPLDDLGATGPNGGSRFVNFAPVAKDDVATTDERQSIDIDVLANDSDPNPNDEVRIVGIEAEDLLGIVTLNEDGTINYDPNGEFTHLGVGEQATETFRYTIVDQFGETDTATVTVQTTGLNDEPEANDDAAETTEKHTVAIDVLANDVDPDVNDELEVVAVEVTNLIGDLQFLDDGTFLYDPAGRFDALGKDQTATDTFRYAISDPSGETAIASVEILINGVNDAPVANDDIAVVDEDGLVRIDALANDFDPDIGDTIRMVNLFSLGGSKGHRWIYDDVVTYRPAGAYDYLGEGEFAIQEFGYTITDQHGATDTGTISVLVTGVNDLPVANDDKVHTNEKTLVEVDVLANDFDPDTNDIIGVVAADATGVLGGLAFLGDGKFAYDPGGQFDHLGKGQTATETFQYALSDQNGAIDIATAKVVIHGVNDAPVAEMDLFTGFTDFGYYAPIEALLANDFDIDNGDTIHFAGLGNSVNGDVTVTPDGFFVFTPTAGFTGLAGFQYAIEDQHGAVSIGDVFLDIRDVAPGDVSFEVLALFDALNEAEVTEHPDGVVTIDMLFDVSALAGGAMLLGDMPFFTAILSGEMQGEMQVVFNPDGSVQADGDVVGDLALDIVESPIFRPLGGDFFEALFGPSPDAFAGGLPTVLHAGGPNSALFAALGDQLQALGLDGMPAEAYGAATAASNALAPGNGTFFLEIGALFEGGATLFDEETGAPEFLAELAGEFAALAAIDIRDGVDVVADGFSDSSFNTSSTPLAFAALASTDITGGIVVDDQAVAA